MLKTSLAEKLGINARSMNYDEIQAKMRELGYDGVIHYDANGEIRTAVTFDSNQIKSATENNGDYATENPDIRYSLNLYDTDAEELTPERKKQIFEQFDKDRAGVDNEA